MGQSVSPVGPITTNKADWHVASHDGDARESVFHLVRKGLELDEEQLERYRTQRDDLNGAWQAALVTRCLAGDESAFAQIVDRYGDVLQRTAYLFVQDEEAAKDIVQESLFLAWKNLSQLREPTALRAWLIRIVVNQSTSLKRQWARKADLLRRQLLQNQLDSAMQVADAERGQLEETLDTWQAIKQLPLNQRIVLVLFYYHRMTMPEIASMLETSENTLRKRLLTGLGKVRKILNIDLTALKESKTGSVQPLRKENAATGVGYTGSKRDE